MDITHYRGFEVKYLASTNTRPDRISIRDRRRRESVIIPFGDGLSIVDRAVDYLQSIGFNVVGFVDMGQTHLILSDSWDHWCYCGSSEYSVKGGAK